MDDSQGNPFDFEDTESYEEPSFPTVNDIQYVAGIRLERMEGGWKCPYGCLHRGSAERAALACLNVCEGREE